MSVHKAANPSLALTARWTAMARAKETERPDRLFNDPWAAKLAGPEGEAWAAQQTGSPFSTAPMVIRTRFFDDFLLQAAEQDQIRQIVMLGAGLDTRAFRLDWPENTHVFELDQPAVLDYKEQVLRSAGAQPACYRHAVAIDLTGPWEEALLHSNFDPQQPSGWLAEG